MHQILFDNDIIIAHDHEVQRFKKDADLSAVLSGIDEAQICVVDFDVQISPAPETNIETKDSLLAREFSHYYSGDYLIQDERIESNLFQVIGIRTERVREIYAQVPSDKVSTFIPYSLAIRHILDQKKIDHKKIIVFLDDLDEEALITVFEGLKFSKTRHLLTSDIEVIFPELKRTQISFKKKFERYLQEKNSDKFSIVTNNKVWADSLSKREEKPEVILIENKYPALEALRNGSFQIKYKLPEEIIRKRKEKELRSRILNYTLSAGIFASGFLFYGINQLELNLLKRDFEKTEARSKQLEMQLSQLDPVVYHDALRRLKTLDYGTSYFVLSNILPYSYSVDSINFREKNQKWSMEVFVYAKDGETYEEIPRSKILKNMHIKDYFVKNRPGKFIKIEL